jgi:small-conductance mechanosensitive channel
MNFFTEIKLGLSENGEYFAARLKRKFYEKFKFIYRGNAHAVKTMYIQNLFETTTNPLLTLVIAAACVIVIGWAAQWLGRTILLRITKRLSIVDNLVRSTAAPMQLIVPLLLLQMLWLTTPDSWEFMGRIRHISGLLLIAALTWLVVRCIDGIANTILFLKPVTTADNLSARRIQTQTRVIARALMLLSTLIGVSLMLMTFPEVRSVGASLLASAGLAGIIAGVAARPVLSNLIAGLQIALSQPLRIDDVLIVEGEWGRVEEITGNYVVLALWDQRRLIIPLQWFIEHPFQNWTRSTSQLLGSVMLWVDYGLPLAPLRAELERICKGAPEWDGRVCVLQAVDTNERALQIRALVSAADSSLAWDLRCRVREELLQFVRKNYPDHLPRVRSSVDELGDALVSLPQKMQEAQKPAQSPIVRTQ